MKLLTVTFIVLIVINYSSLLKIKKKVAILKTGKSHNSRLGISEEQTINYCKALQDWDDQIKALKEDCKEI